MLNRFALYELCVQDAGTLVALLHAIHGGDPRVLGEDFCGTAAIARAWLCGGEQRRAIAVDHDDEVLEQIPATDGLTRIAGDVIDAVDAREHGVDILHAGNFSIGEWHTRPALLRYLRQARARMRPGGVFVCDTYGGEGAFVTGTVDRDLPIDDDGIVRYEWEQRRADPLTAIVENAIHFEVRRRGEVVQRLDDAFLYHWRLWGVAELRDALVEAGFERTEVYAKVPDAVDGDGCVYLQPLQADDVDESFDVLVAAR